MARPQSAGAIFMDMLRPRAIHGIGAGGYGLMFGMRLALQHPEYVAAFIAIMYGANPSGAAEVEEVKQGVDRFVMEHPLEGRMP